MCTDINGHVRGWIKFVVGSRVTTADIIRPRLVESTGFSIRLRTAHTGFLPLLLTY